MSDSDQYRMKRNQLIWQLNSYY
ncbi:unnamed protein product [Staurois parvus]|uniref:Uncharacterized protein n=1 Tax=Staurois parvus TaxID=386267 RepID=A0ABN9DK21_9NEOB|nr:unnamed protein product [Staurois parvus]